MFASVSSSRDDGEPTVKQGRRRVYHGVLNIPEGRAGQFQIVHDRRPPGTTFPLVTVRTAIPGGDALGTVSCAEPTRWHKLLEDGQVWMSDYPIEQAQHDAALTPIRNGRVLVGGLGLGYAATVLARRPRIREVVVVEKAPEVCELVGPWLLADEPGARAKVTLVRQDLFAYLRSRSGKFTWAFYDIWAGDSEHVFFSTVVPLLQLSVGLVTHRPICWNEHVMRSQLLLSLRFRCLLLQDLGRSATPTGELWHDWAVPFFQWVVHTKPTARQLEDGAQLYAKGYGHPGFEATWARIYTYTGKSTRNPIQPSEG